MPGVPTSPAAKACFDAVEQHAPELWTQLQERLLPVAAGGSLSTAERIRELRRLGDAAWQAFRAEDRTGAARALGRSWPCCVEDVAAAAALEAIGSAPREELEGILSALQEGPETMPSTTRASMRLRGALAEGS